MTRSALPLTAPPGEREWLLAQLRDQLAREAWLRERLLAHQRARLGELLGHAIEHSPYYARARP